MQTFFLAFAYHICLFYLTILHLTGEEEEKMLLKFPIGNRDEFKPNSKIHSISLVRYDCEITAVAHDNY